MDYGRRRWAAAGSLLLGIAAQFGACPRAHADEAGEALAGLRAAVAEGRLARAHAETLRLARPLEEAWTAAVFASLTRPPAGWSSDDAGHVEGSGAEGPTFVRGLRRGERASVRFVVHTFRNESDKPDAGNAPWFTYWEGDDRARRIPWAGRSALLVMEAGEEGDKELGLPLAGGAALGVIAHGVSSADLALFGPAIDLAALERALDRGSPTGDARSLTEQASRAFGAKRFGACFEALRLLRQDLEQRCRAPMSALLAVAPAGWTLGAETPVEMGLGREWSRGEGERLSAYLTWEDQPNTNGLLDSLRDPEKRRHGQRVIQHAGATILLEEPSLEWEVRVGVRRAHVFFFDGYARLDLRSENVSFDAGIAPLLAALAPTKMPERLAPLW